MFDFTVLVPLAVVAVTSFYNQIKAKDYEGALTIVVAAVVGLLAGLLHVDNLTVTQGVAAGLAAVGVHTVGLAVGGIKSSKS